MTEETLFHEARSKANPQERATFLDAACAGQPELRAAVEALLAANDRADSLFNRPAVPRPAGSAGPHITASEGPGSTIGSYKLVEPIGEGGFGVVYMAEQKQPIRRTVALKILKPGMDTRQVITRFETERQALAVMEHTNIARVLEAGETAAGRPYFVMELVKGVPITKYCDEHQLTPRERLALFAQVCQAIQHAHQKGIIHRDLKPSNVLIAAYDGKPVPKVIDFGVAKALGQPLTERTLATGFGGIVGTLEYMSPEQAEFNALDVDTRSDIYSLGVLLYELLTGTTPLTKERIHQTAMSEVLRLIREEDPPRPSTRLSDSKDTLASVSAQRKLDPVRLTKELRGELDWIVMKALEKDRSRRYETANSFAMDVERYLADEPVQACPPSTVYRLRKYARRNRSGLAVAGLIFLFLVVLGSLAGWSWRDRAARVAEQAIHLERAVERAELLEQEAKHREASAALERARLLAHEVEPASPLANRIDSLQQRLDAETRDEVFVAQFEAIRREEQTEVDINTSTFQEENAYPKLRSALEQYGISIGVTPAAAAVSRIQNRPVPIQASVVAALNDCLRFVNREDSDTRQWLIDVLLEADGDPWRNKVRRAWTQPETLDALVQDIDVHQQPPGFLVLVVRGLPIGSPNRWNLARNVQFAYPGDFWANLQLGLDLAGTGKHAEAIRYYTAALAVRPDNPGVLINRSQSSRSAGELDAAVTDLRRAVAVAPRYAAAYCALADALGLQGNLDEAIDVYQQAIRIQPDKADSHRAFAFFLRDIKQDYDAAIGSFNKVIELDPKNVQAYNNLAHTQRNHEKFDDAIGTYRKAIELDPKNVEAYFHLGLAQRQSEKLDDAVDSYRKAIELDPKNPNRHRELGLALGLLGKLDEAIESYQQAIRIQPDKAHSHHAFGCFLRDIKRDYEGAIGSFNTAIELDPTNARIHYDFGHTLRRHGKLNEAAAAFREALRLNPDGTSARDGLAWVLNKLAWPLATHPEPTRRDPDRAVSLAREAVELMPRNGTFHNTLGIALYRAGRWDEALEALKSADQLSVDKPVTSNACFIAMAYWQLGDKVEARKWYDRAVGSMNKILPNIELMRFRGEASELLNLQSKNRTNQIP